MTDIRVFSRVRQQVVIEGRLVTEGFSADVTSELLFQRVSREVTRQVSLADERLATNLTDMGPVSGVD